MPANAPPDRTSANFGRMKHPKAKKHRKKHRKKAKKHQARREVGERQEGGAPWLSSNAPEPFSSFSRSLCSACWSAARTRPRRWKVRKSSPIEAFTSDVRSSVFDTIQPLPQYQAGGHPDIAFRFDLTTRGSLPKSEYGANSVKDLRIELPAGISANPHAVAQCSASRFALNECSPNTQVGVARPCNNLGDSEFCLSPGPSAIYNLVPQPGQPGSTPGRRSSSGSRSTPCSARAPGVTTGSTRKPAGSPPTSD